MSADIATVEWQSGQKVYMALMSAWGYLADLDIESEWLRFIGEPRYVVEGLKVVMQRRVYQGRFHYLPFEEELEDGGEGGGGGHNQLQSHGSVEQNKLPLHEEAVQQQEPELAPATDLLPPLSDSVPSSWKTIEGNFVVVTSQLGPFIGHRVTLGSGKMCVTYCLDDVTRIGMLTSLLTYGTTGEYLQREDYHTVKTRAFRLEPLTSPGIIAIDGEEMEYGPHQVQLHPRLLCFMSRRRRENQFSNDFQI